MDRPTLYVGLLLILGMCLVPPFEAGPVDQVGDMLRGDPVREVEYRPLWTHPGLEEGGSITEVSEGNIAGGRLLLQILAVAGGTALVAFWRGS
jgi:hypothetical protein